MRQILRCISTACLYIAAPKLVKCAVDLVDDRLFHCFIIKWICIINQRIIKKNLFSSCTHMTVIVLLCWLENNIFFSQDERGNAAERQNVRYVVRYYMCTRHWVAEIVPNTFTKRDEDAQLIVWHVTHVKPRRCALMISRLTLQTN